MPSTPLRPRWLRLSLRSLALLLISLGLAACGGGRPPRPPPGAMGGDEGGPAVPMPPMEAKGLFFDGQIEVEALLARAGSSWSHDDESGGSRRGGRSRGRSGGFSGGMGMGGGGMRGGFGGGGGGRGRPGEGGGPPEGGTDGGAQRAPMRASDQPPIQLRLRLINHGTAPADVAVLDFDSALGNFVVQPQKITIQPGESVEAAPMVSRLGAPEGEIPLTVRLRVGDRSEQQVLTLRAVKEASPEAAPPAPPPQ